MKLEIFTVGHSRRAFSEFLNVLQKHEIDTLVDVRTFPKSRFPWFNQKLLSTTLSEHNITYSFCGKNLGGLGKNVKYQETIGELVRIVKSGKRVCVMCSEKDFKKCHRYTMLTPSFEKKGLEVKHIGL